MNLQQLCADACKVAKEAGLFMLHERANFKHDMIEIKSFNQLVSYVDKTSEELLVKGLSNLLPKAGFITEEKTVKTQYQPFMWVIDPLDGTTNYIHNIPVYSVSIALLHNQKPVIGIVYEVCRDEMFYAWQGGGAYLNGKRIGVKQNTVLEKSLLATGFPYYDFEIMNQYLLVLKYFMTNTQGMRRMGSAAVDLAYTACGRFDGFFEYGLHAWDVAGGICLIEEAGGIVKDFNGGNDYLFGKTIIASSLAIYKPFAAVIQTHFYNKKN
jgi:myo-inositol-1(or 4)-monophosphatase